MSNNGNSNTINVKTLMKENAYVVEKNGSRKYLKISPESIQEYKKRVEESIESNLPLIASIADKDGRSTIMSRNYPGSKPDVCDVTMFFCFKDSHVVNSDSRKYVVVEKQHYRDLVRRASNGRCD